MGEKRPRVFTAEHHAPGSLYALELGRKLKRYCDNGSILMIRVLEENK